MEIRGEQTVREIAAGVAGATRVFEQAGIDYCCGGGKSLAEACTDASVDMGSVLASLERLEQEPSSHGTPIEGSLNDLVDHIIDVHHEFTRAEMVRLTRLLETVSFMHEANHPELAEIKAAFAELVADLGAHMLKEEMMLFPYIRALERAARAGRPAPLAPFGTVHNPIRVMLAEHETASDLLKRIREASAGFAPPKDACLSFTSLYEGLAAFERDLHEHIHLESNVLFPRAVEIVDAR
jgi:regulator of cell morphogenesis and NO signaling